MLTLDTARAWYDETDVVHGYAHVVRVYQLVQRLASFESADDEIVCAAALLHDVQGDGADQAAREQHHIHAANFAAGVLYHEGWIQERILQVQHCIRSHRYRDESEKPETLEARILFDADKLDAIGATGVMRAIVYAVQHGKPAYATPSNLFLTIGDLEETEPHSAYHEYLFKLRNIRDCLFTEAARNMANLRHENMSHYFEALASEMQALQ